MKENFNATIKNIITNIFNRNKNTEELVLAEKSRELHSKELHNLELYKLTRKVVDIVFECIAEDSNLKDKYEDRREDGLSPSHQQTATGLFLELSANNSVPKLLWTPWGKLSMIGSSWDNFDSILPVLIKRFDLKLHRESGVVLSEDGVLQGENGQVYMLQKVDDTPLPEATELKEEFYASYEESNAAWEELGKQTSNHNQ